MINNVRRWAAFLPEHDQEESAVLLSTLRVLVRSRSYFRTPGRFIRPLWWVHDIRRAPFFRTIPTTVVQHARPPRWTRSERTPSEWATHYRFRSWGSKARAGPRLARTGYKPFERLPRTTKSLLFFGGFGAFFSNHSRGVYTDHLCGYRGGIWCGHRSSTRDNRRTGAWRWRGQSLCNRSQGSSYGQGAWPPTPELQRTMEIRWKKVKKMKTINDTRSKKLPLSLPRVINVKFPLQPHQQYYITQYEELGFS